MSLDNIIGDLLRSLGITIGVEASVRMILRQHITLPLFLRIPILKFKLGKKYHEYISKTAVTDFWKDNLGKYYGPEELESEEPILLGGDQARFKDVVLTDFVPRAPGFYYSKEFWNASYDGAKFSDVVKRSSGVERIVWGETSADQQTEPDVRIVTINKPLQFEAHTNIEEGIPLIVTRNVYQRISERMDRFGSVHANEILTTLSSIPKAYADRFSLPYHARRVFPTLKSIEDIKGTGDPLDSPILGHAWIVYMAESRLGYARYRFWTGVEHHNPSLDRASNEIRQMIPKGAAIVTNFDEKKESFSEAKLKSFDVRKLLNQLITSL